MRTAVARGAAGRYAPRVTDTPEAPTAPSIAVPVACRFCGATLRDTFVDLGPQPLCESFVAPEDVERMEPFYPLHVRICRECLLVQLPAYVDREDIFREYAYFSSFSDSWVEHARQYADAMIQRRDLGGTSLVVELASNDGYLLQHFVARGVPVLGVEPAHNVAAAAEARGVPTLTEFFGRDLAERLVRERGHADLVIGNNVLAQVPDLNDFVAGIATLLAPQGVATLEFPHVVRLVEGVQFDTIYHEHFSYFSLTTVSAIARAHGLNVVDVEELSTHGGSLRVFLARADGDPTVAPAVDALLASERERWLREPRGVRRLRGARARGQAIPADVPDRVPARRALGRGLRGAGQGQHAAQLLRDPDRPPRLHRRPQPVQARPVHAGDADPDPRPGSARRDPSRRHPDPALEPADGDREATRVHPRVGRAPCRAHPDDHGDRLTAR